MAGGRECARVAPLLDELIDGTLDERRASAVRGHARTCDACRARLEETRALAERLAALEPLEPPPSLWGRIEARLGEEEVADARRSGWWWWWQQYRKGLAYGLAGAAAVAVAVTTFVIREQPTQPVVTTPTPHPHPTPAADVRDALYDRAVADLEQADADYRRAIDHLKSLARAERARWAPEVARAFDANLAAIDAAIDRQRDLARRDPSDLGAQEALYASYRKQIEFLQEAVVRGQVTP